MQMGEKNWVNKVVEKNKPLISRPQIAKAYLK